MASWKWGFLHVLIMEDEVHWFYLTIKWLSVFSDPYLIVSACVTGIMGIQKTLCIINNYYLAHFAAKYKLCSTAGQRPAGLSSSWLRLAVAMVPRLWGGAATKKYSRAEL